MRFLYHTQRRTTVGRTPLDEWSARSTDLYLTTHNTHNRKTSMPSVKFEPTISAGERPQNYALERAVTRTGKGAIRGNFVWHDTMTMRQSKIWSLSTVTRENCKENPCCQLIGCFYTSSADISKCCGQHRLLVQWSHVAIVFPPITFSIS